MRNSIAAKARQGLSDQLLGLVARIIQRETGIHLGERQRKTVESRLLRRLHELEVEDESDYVRHLESPGSPEVQELVSLLTTHHTYFFREYSQFEYLEREGLERLTRAAKERGERVLRVWSAACSTGQEAYSIAMFLAYHLPRIAPGFGFEILGTDIDAKSVAFARNGVYSWKEVSTAPIHFLSGNWLRGSGEISAFARAGKAIRQACRFEVVNLNDLNGTACVAGKTFDLIFCRNAFIYFQNNRIRAITLSLLEHLETNGQLFVGISESLGGLDLPLESQGPSIYRRRREIANEASAPLATPALLKVLCIDDSPSVLALLKRVFDREHGFEVIATAKNGLDAAAALAKMEPGKRADVVTLDIHMPEQDGIEYLRSNVAGARAASHPPVVMISSVSRDDASLALRSLELGASDYVEKPTLNTLAQQGDEIRMKVRAALHRRETVAPGAGSGILGLDRSLARSRVKPGARPGLRILVAGLGDRARLPLLLEQLDSSARTVVLVEGSAGALPAFAASLGAGGPGRGALYAESAELILKSGPESCFLGDFRAIHDRLLDSFRDAPVSILVLGDLTSQAARELQRWPHAQILVEDGSKGNQRPDRFDVVPLTSFAYLSDRFLAESVDESTPERRIA